MNEQVPYTVDRNDHTKVYVDETLSVSRHVVCAANRYGDVIVPANSHHSPSMNTLLKLLALVDTSKLTGATALGLDQLKSSLRGKNQGFIDQYGIYMTREQAVACVKASGQTLRDETIYAGELFSENLY